MAPNVIDIKVPDDVTGQVKVKAVNIVVCTQIRLLMLPPSHVDLIFYTTFVILVLSMYSICMQITYLFLC